MREKHGYKFNIVDRDKCIESQSHSKSCSLYFHGSDFLNLHEKDVRFVWLVRTLPGLKIFKYCLYLSSCETYLGSENFLPHNPLSQTVKAYFQPLV